MKEQIEKMTSEYKSNVQSLNDQLKELKNTLEEKSKLLDEQIGKTQIAEKALIESQNIIEDLRTKITESENNKPNPGSICYPVIKKLLANYGIDKYTKRIILQIYLRKEKLNYGQNYKQLKILYV